MNQQLRFCRDFLLVSCPIIFFAQSARAHHIALETGRGHASVETMAGIETEAAGFTLAGSTGNFFTLAAKGSYLIFENFAVSARIPFEILWLNAQSPVTGLGDINLGVKYQLIGEDAHLVSESQLSVGLETELPTGSTEKGLGGGHLELVPYVSGMQSAGNVMLHGTFAALFAVETNPGQPDTISWINPHTDRELQYHVGALYPFTDVIYANLVLGGYTSLVEDPDLGGTGLYISPTVGFTPGDWRISLGPLIPFGPNRRYDWKVAATVLYVF